MVVMMGLESLNKRGNPKSGLKILLIATIASMFLILVSFMVLGVGAYAVLAGRLDLTGEKAVDYVTTTTSTTKTTSTTIMTSTTTSSTTSTTTTSTTTSTSTTTTTLCGGEYQMPCMGGECNPGYIIGSTGLCHPTECAPSVSSGRDGCGAFALQFCRD